MVPWTPHSMRGTQLEQSQSRTLKHCTVQFSSHTPHVAVEPFRCDWSKSRWAVRARNIPDFEALAGEKRYNHFYIDYLLKWQYFRYKLNKIYFKNEFHLCPFTFFLTRPLKNLKQHTWFIQAEAEAPILWPSDANSQLTGKDPDTGKDGR